MHGRARAKRINPALMEPNGGDGDVRSARVHVYDNTRFGVFIFRINISYLFHTLRVSWFENEIVFSLCRNSGGAARTRALASIIVPSCHGHKKTRPPDQRLDPPFHPELPGCCCCSFESFGRSGGGDIHTTPLPPLHLVSPVCADCVGRWNRAVSRRTRNESIKYRRPRDKLAR